MLHPPGTRHHRGTPHPVKSVEQTSDVITDRHEGPLRIRFSSATSRSRRLPVVTTSTETKFPTTLRATPAQCRRSGSWNAPCLRGEPPPTRRYAEHVRSGRRDTTTHRARYLSGTGHGRCRLVHGTGESATRLGRARMSDLRVGSRQDGGRRHLRVAAGVAGGGISVLSAALAPTTSNFAEESTPCSFASRSRCARL